MTLLTMCVAIWLVMDSAITWRLYPYFFPQHVCLTKDGNDTGLGKKCLFDGRMGLEVRALGSTLGTAESIFSVYSNVNGICKKACQSNKFCSRYVVRLPDEMYDKHIIVEDGGNIFACFIIGSKPRKAS